MRMLSKGAESPELPLPSVARSRNGAAVIVGNVTLPVQPFVPDKFTVAGVSGRVAPPGNTTLRLTVPVKPERALPSMSAAETVMFKGLLTLTMLLNALNR